MISRLTIRNIPTVYQIIKNATCSINLSAGKHISCLSTSTEPGVDYDYVKKAVENKNAFIIDVRDPEELKEHDVIPSSIHIPLANVKNALQLSEKEFQNTYKTTKPKEDSELIFYCMIGKRSAKAQRNASELGFKNAKNYLGSWNDWVVRSKM